MHCRWMTRSPRPPWVYGDILPVLWDAAKATDGKIYGVPQDAEIRMFFYNKDMLREIGKDEAFIEGLPAKVEAGEFTLDDLTALSKEVVGRRCRALRHAAPPECRHRLPDGLPVLRPSSSWMRTPASWCSRRRR